MINGTFDEKRSLLFIQLKVDHHLTTMAERLMRIGTQYLNTKLISILYSGVRLLLFQHLFPVLGCQFCTTLWNLAVK